MTNGDIVKTLVRIETQLQTLIDLENKQNNRIEKTEVAIDRLRLKMAYGVGFAGGLAVIWTVVSTLYHLMEA